MGKGRAKLPNRYLPGISDCFILEKPLKLVTPLEFQKIRAQKDYHPIDQTKHIIGFEDTLAYDSTYRYGLKT